MGNSRTRPAGSASKPEGTRAGGRRPPALAAVAILLAPALLVVSADPALADTLQRKKDLVTATYHAPAVWTGAQALLFGGNGNQTRIQAYDPAANLASVAGAPLPVGVLGAAAVWTGSHALVFGGQASSAPGRVQRYDPATGTATTLAGAVQVLHASAVWTGQHAYLFGGEFRGVKSNAILRYDPARDVFATMGAKLPAAITQTSAAWDGKHAYVFGGSSDLPSAQILRYDPARDEIKVMGASLPTPRYATSAVWDGHAFLVFGGCCDHVDVLKYEPASDAVTVMSQRFAYPVYATGAVWTGKEALVLGGKMLQVVSYTRNFIHRYTSEPGAPIVVSILPGPGAGEVTLNWQPPPANSHTAAIGGYRIYRQDPGAVEKLLADVGAVRTFTDVPPRPVQAYSYRVSAWSVHGEGPKTTAIPSIGKPTPRTATHPDGYLVVFDDRNGNGAPDPGEEVGRQSFPVLSQGPFAKAEPLRDGKLDRVHYKVGALVRMGGREYGQVLEGTHDGPLPFTTPAYPTSAERGPDQDGDGIPGSVLLRYQTTTITDTGARIDAPAPPSPLGVDPDDTDATWPLPRISEGPHRDVARDGGDGVRYRLGLVLVLRGVPHDFVEEGRIDAGRLPLTLEVPAGTPPIPGPDADRDGIPAYYEVSMKAVTIQDDAALTRTEAPAAPRRIAADPRDDDASFPAPQLVGSPQAGVTPRHDGDTYAVDYRVSARARAAGNDVGVDERGPIVGPLTDRNGNLLDDGSEALLCANENPNYAFDGSCDGAGWAAPGAAGLVEDARRLLP